MKKKHVHAEFISLNISLSNKKKLPKTGSTDKSIFIISSSLGGGGRPYLFPFLLKRFLQLWKVKKPVTHNRWDEIAITVNSKNFKMAYQVS